MADNVLAFPTVGKAITAADQGVYFTMNPTTGMVHSIFRLDFEREWYLHQLQNTVEEDEFAWVLMAAHSNDTIVSMTPSEIKLAFDKPEYQAPKGAWQIIRNSLFGFGKFTPQAAGAEIRYGLIPFVGEVMQPPVAIVKADEAQLNQAQAALGDVLENA